MRANAGSAERFVTGMSPRARGSTPVMKMLRMTPYSAVASA